MSGIYIPGMEMPKDGTYSIVYVYSDGHVSMPFWGKGMQIVSGITAVPVPEHGRLIDADALMANAEYKGKHDILTAYDVVAAPTIIPASGGTDNE